MRTQIMNDPKAGTPWFEYYQVGGSRPTKQKISEFPFVIGRDDAADFRVDSSRVSRKHIEIDRIDGALVLRDLESTNGTYVNGKRVTELILSDGDVLIIADFELTFFTGNPVSRGGATQVMTEPVGASLPDTVDTIYQIRRQNEILTHCATVNRFQPIVDLESGCVFGYRAVREPDVQPGQAGIRETVIDGMECRLTLRINQQHRLIAAEQATQLGGEPHIFFGLQVSEINTDSIPESLGILAETIVGGCQLVAEIPDSTACDIPYFRRFLDRLHGRGIEIAYTNFCHGPTQIANWSEMAPDYVRLAPALTQGICSKSDAARALESIIRAAQNLGCRVIAAGVDDSADAQRLREFGCHFAHGDHFGRPSPIETWIDRSADRNQRNTGVEAIASLSVEGNEDGINRQL